MQMKKYRYQCSLLTDVVITSSAGSEGYKESLDYIPGSKFLGIVANKLYDESNESKTLDLFHNGVVHFGDASIAIGKNDSFKIPFSWYHKKGKSLSESVYLHHLLSNEDKQNGEQLKQAREGYFSPDLKKYVVIEQDFAIKSAHDREMRKSKDSQMYGYYSLKKGSKWSFVVTDESGKYADEVKTILEGKHRVGRSRSAEYGLVEIEFVEECEVPVNLEYKDELILYAQSNLCFYINGKSTAQPTSQQLIGIDSANILWEKSQVRSRNYKTWNRHRNNKDADRIIIEKGSVLVVHLKENLSSEFFEKGIGSHKNEGFGDVLINPGFLASETSKLPYSLTKVEQQYEGHFAVIDGPNDLGILACLKAREEGNNFDAKIDKLVNEFKQKFEKDFDGISKSQWGTIRNFGKNANSYQVFEKLVFGQPDFGALYRGQSEPDWRKKDRRGKLETFVKRINTDADRLPFIVKLSSLMSKKD